MVRCHNFIKSPQYYFGEPTEEGYYQKMANAFKKVMSGRTIKGHVTVDCANGVGGPKLRQLLKYLPSSKDGGLDINVVNDDVITPSALNYDVSFPFSRIYLTNLVSVVPTTSKLVNELPHPPKLHLSNVAAPLTVTPTESSTITSMIVVNSRFLTAIVLQLLQLYSSQNKFVQQVSRVSKSESSKPLMPMVHPLNTSRKFSNSTSSARPLGSNIFMQQPTDSTSASISKPTDMAQSSSPKKPSIDSKPLSLRPQLANTPSTPSWL